MSLFKKRLKIGRRVTTITHSFKSGRDEFKIGKVVATRPQKDGDYWDSNYAVRFDDGQIEVFSARQLFTEWEGLNDPSSSL